MMRPFDYDILVSGGGVAGLTAAAVFGSAGFTVLCVDPAPPITAREAEGADQRSTAFLQPAQALLDSARASPLNATEEGPAWGPVLEPLLNPRARSRL